MSHPSRILQLVEARLGRPLADHAREMRHRGASWHAITVDLSARTDVTVTPETLRIWMSEEPDMDRRKPSEVGAA